MYVSWHTVLVCIVISSDPEFLCILCTRDIKLIMCVLCLCDASLKLVNRSEHIGYWGLCQNLWYVCMYVYSRGGPQTALAPRPSLIYLNLWHTQLPVLWVCAFSMEMKWSEHEADHSSLSSTKAETAWNFTSTPSYSSWHRGSFSFCLTLDDLVTSHSLYEIWDFHRSQGLGCVPQGWDIV
jgi:hypothetical protein